MCMNTCIYIFLVVEVKADPQHKKSFESCRSSKYRKTINWVDQPGIVGSKMKTIIENHV